MGKELQVTPAELDPNVSKLRWFMRGKTRVFLAWAFAVALVLCAKTLPNIGGILLCFLGATIRFWASGHLRKDDKPAIGGPYSMTRNPLYLGTYLMALGTAVAISAWWLLIVASILFAVVYHFVITDEEVKLDKIFGESYGIFKDSVPRFFPRLYPASRSCLLKINPDEDHLKFSWNLAMRNKAYEAYASFLGLIGFVAIVATLWQKVL